MVEALITGLRIGRLATSNDATRELTIDRTAVFYNPATYQAPMEAGLGQHLIQHSWFDGKVPQDEREAGFFLLDSAPTERFAPCY